MAEEQRGKYYYKSSDVLSTLHEKAEGMNIGAFNLASDPEHYDVQRSNTFEFYVYGLNNITQAPGAVNQYAVANAEDVLRLSVESTDIPHYSQDAITISRGNTDIRYAGKPKYSGTLQMKFIDFIGAGTLEALMAWQNCSADMSTLKVGLANDYKRLCTLTEYTPTWQPVRQWRLYGCWIGGITEDAFNYTSSDKRTITATLTYDYALLEEVNAQE